MGGGGVWGWGLGTIGFDDGDHPHLGIILGMFPICIWGCSPFGDCFDGERFQWGPFPGGVHFVGVLVTNISAIQRMILQLILLT